MFRTQQIQTRQRSSTQSPYGEIDDRGWVFAVDRDGDVVAERAYPCWQAAPEGTQATGPHKFNWWLRVAYRWPKVVGGLLTLVGIALACWALMQGGLCAVVGGVVLA